MAITLKSLEARIDEQAGLIINLLGEVRSLQAEVKVLRERPVVSNGRPAYNRPAKPACPTCGEAKGQGTYGCVVCFSALCKALGTATAAKAVIERAGSLSAAMGMVETEVRTITPSAGTPPTNTASEAEVGAPPPA